MVTTVETDYKTARETISSRNLRITNAFNIFVNEKFGPGDVRETFLIDGSPIISRAEFGLLPPALQDFFAKDRITLPPTQHTFASEENAAPIMKTKHLADMVALRGLRFYGADGKYPWGPNETNALTLLAENIQQDTLLLSHLENFDTVTRATWMAKIAAWDYIRNDLSAVYYLQACRAALDQSPNNTKDLLAIDLALEAVTTQYMNTLFLLPSTSVDIVHFDKASQIVRSSFQFVRDHEFQDVVRCHRELGNPHAAVFAFHLMYETSQVYDADLIAAPLYGAIDIGHALRYVMKHGDAVYRHIVGKNPPRAAAQREILFFHHKIIPRGKPRSEMAGVHAINPKGLSLLDNIPQSVRQKILDAENVLFVDDSAGTFGSRNEIIKWVHENISATKKYVWSVAHGGIRWAKAQNASFQEIIDAQTIASTPLSKRFKDPLYAGGRSGYLPDAVIANMILQTERTALSLPDAQKIIEKLFEYGILKGVGYDLYETLVCRTVNRDERRHDLNKMAAAIFTQAGFPITAEAYYQITRPVWRADIETMAKTNQEIDFYTTLRKMVKQVESSCNFTMTRQQKNELITAIANSELIYEYEHTIANEGSLHLLSENAKMGLPQGIYSNTPYPQEFMQRVIDNTGIFHFIEPSRILYSSATGVVKPGKETMTMLADALKINVENMAFLDNSPVGVEAAMRARAIPVRLLYTNEDVTLEKRIKEWTTFKHTITQK